MRVARLGPVPSAAAFNYGTARLRVQLGWPRATVEDDGSIHAKLGWWRGAPGRLRITGRRLDATAPPLEAHVPAGYGQRGFQPTGRFFRVDSPRTRP